MGGHGGEQTITSDILLAGDFGGIQCGWSSEFTIESTIRNAAGSPNAELRIQFDSGTVYLNGDVQITGALRINDAVKTDGSLPMTVGGLQGGTKNTTVLNFGNTGTSTLTLNLPETRTATYDGTLSGGFSIVKTGLGTQVFSQTPTHTGGTTIEQGIIQLTKDATPGSALEIQTDGTLQMDLGNYDLRNTTLSGDGTILWTMASADQYSQAEFGDMSDWNGVFNFLFASDFTPTADDSFVIADVFPDMGSDFQWDSLLAPEMRYAWNLNPVNGGLVLGMDRAAVPEPGSWILLGLGLLGILGVSRFQKRG
ncbi:MAG: PEP-CTERM sorting domain-containing protein, partial [Planctomycetia bacterium]|nr:PEP-CTERM sorting domain-containing protein [Planctomycetia bacterium]